MRENIKELNRLSEVLYAETRLKDTVSHETAKTWQCILDDMQEKIDEIKKEASQE